MTVELVLPEGFISSLERDFPSPFLRDLEDISRPLVYSSSRLKIVNINSSLERNEGVVLAVEFRNGNGFDQGLSANVPNYSDFLITSCTAHGQHFAS